MWKTLTYLAIYLAIWGPGGGGGFNYNQTGPILVHIYPLFYINLHVKTRRLCVLSNTKLYHRNLLLLISTKFAFWMAKTIFHPKFKYR